MMEFRKQIAKRLYLLSMLIVLFGMILIGRLVDLQFIEGDELKTLEEQSVIQEIEMPANRGNIFAQGGEILVTTMPKYALRFDPISVKSGVFESNVQALARSLSNEFGQKTTGEWERELRAARSMGNRYVLIAKEVDFPALLRIREFPIFREGRYSGGLIAEPMIKRVMPYGKLAERTLGYEREGLHVGLEGAYSAWLSGQTGVQLAQRLQKGAWKPLDAEPTVRAIDGYDLVTTLDVRIQDIAHQALLRRLEYHEADHGCVVVMEVATGKIKAIANLGRTEEGKYYEMRNYAVWESTEPGSTIKLASLMAILEDQVADTSDQVDTHGGKYDFYGFKVRDSHEGGFGVISLGDAFVLSSNVGISRMVFDHYGDRPSDFVDRYYAMGLGEKLDLDIQGEGTPRIPTPKDANWSGLTLPWMSHGYALSLTPLQVLSLYNAVANNGQEMKPMFVEALLRNGKVHEQFEPRVRNTSICGEETLLKVQELMRQVVERGTATNIYDPELPMAGKTGTCQLNYWKKDEELDYQASFAGYFPADDPRYSCIVVVHKPKLSTGYYGNRVAAPVFSEIAHRVMASEPLKPVEFIQNDNSGVYWALAKDVPALEGEGAISSTGWYAVENGAPREMEIGQRLPDMEGMTGMDAIYLMESLGIRVSIEGKGQVVWQSETPGKAVKDIQHIKLRLRS
jgi:cell division protein FtsI (penicillin-binding protein 3)